MRPIGQIERLGPLFELYYILLNDRLYITLKKIGRNTKYINFDQQNLIFYIFHLKQLFCKALLSKLLNMSQISFCKENIQDELHNFYRIFQLKTIILKYAYFIKTSGLFLCHQRLSVAQLEKERSPEIDLDEIAESASIGDFASPQPEMTVSMAKSTVKRSSATRKRQNASKNSSRKRRRLEPLLFDDVPVEIDEFTVRYELSICRVPTSRGKSGKVMEKFEVMESHGK